MGAAFAEGLAARGIDVVMVARGSERLEELARMLESRYSVDTLTITADLGAPDARERIVGEIGAREVGCAIYNAAVVPEGPFLEESRETLDCRLSRNRRPRRIFGFEILRPGPRRISLGRAEEQGDRCAGRRGRGDRHSRLSRYRVS